MPCYKPLTGFRGRSGAFVFDKREAVLLQEIKVPCGQCIGCRLERSRQWAVRIMHEASLYDANCFVTLTYDEDHIPEDGSLNKAHFQGFMKRLRSRYAGQSIRFFHCGEYGEQFSRPHYHCVLFNFDPVDKKFFKDTECGRLYTSEILADVWSRGFVLVGAVTFESAAYVARYVCKKVTGNSAEDWYWRLNAETGELTRVEPEYATMSRRPGIGKKWYDEYKFETYRDDGVVMRGMMMRPPRYYDRLFDIESPDDLAKLKRLRVKNSMAYKENNTEERLAVREKVQEAKMALFLTRSYEK